MNELRNVLENERNRSMLEISRYEERVRSLTRELEMSKRNVGVSEW